MSLIDSPAFHLSHNSFLRASGNPGRPSLPTLVPPIRTTQKTLPCCTDRLNPPLPSFYKFPSPLSGALFSNALLTAVADLILYFWRILRPSTTCKSAC